MKSSIAILMLLLLTGHSAYAQTDSDIKSIKQTLDSWNQGWAEKNVALAIQDYAENVDWTNAFGDRFQGRDELKKGLEFIFSLDFVMAGVSGGNEFEDVTFLSPDNALFRSKLIRTGQKTSAGVMMPDRHIHHLRVLQRRDGKWQIVSHLISQSHEKGKRPDKKSGEDPVSEPDKTSTQLGPTNVETNTEPIKQNRPPIIDVQQCRDVLSSANEMRILGHEGIPG